MRIAAAAFATGMLFATTVFAQHAGHGQGPQADQSAPEPPRTQNAPASPAGSATPTADFPVVENSSPGNEAAPPPPQDHAADQAFDPAQMRGARDLLRREHGGEPQWMSTQRKQIKFKQRERASGQGIGSSGPCSWSRLIRVWGTSDCSAGHHGGGITEPTHRAAAQPDNRAQRDNHRLRHRFHCHHAPLPQVTCLDSSRRA